MSVETAHASTKTTAIIVCIYDLFNEEKVSVLSRFVTGDEILVHH